MNIIRSLRAGAYALFAAMGLIALTMMPVSAHIGLKADTYEAGSTAIVTFGFGHGCDDSPTTGLAIQVPERILSVQPVLAEGWSIEKEIEGLASPVAGAHGEEITERTATVTFTADEPVETEFYAMVSLRIVLPEDAAGETIFFPVVQGCVEGENAWIEIPADGEDPDSLESPAPSISVIERADDDSDGH